VAQCEQQDQHNAGQNLLLNRDDRQGRRNEAEGAGARQNPVGQPQQKCPMPMGSRRKRGTYFRNGHRVIHAKYLLLNRSATLTRLISTGTSTSGPITAAKAAPWLIPKTPTATAMANSKLLLAAVKERVADLP